MKSRKGKRDTNILLIDCSNLVYAAFHTTGMLSWEGKPTGIVYGFLRKLLMLSQKFNTNRFITCWDGVHTHRHNDYKGYKQKRIERKEQFTDIESQEYQGIKEQTLDLQNKVLPALGFMNNFFQPEYEADDLLAHWVKHLYKKGWHNLIMVTSDNDMFQCLELCKIYLLSTKKIFTIKHFRKKYGIEPYEWPFAKAMGGCASDDVIGIQGVSDPKGGTSYAIKYIRNELTKGKVFDRICSREGKRIIKRNLPIVTCPYRPDDMGTMIRRRDKFSRKKFLKVFDEYHFKSFLKKEKFDEWKSAFLR